LVPEGRAGAGARARPRRAARQRFGFPERGHVRGGDAPLHPLPRKRRGARGRRLGCPSLPADGRGREDRRRRAALGEPLMAERAIVVVQVRLGSTRLPRKALAEIGGGPAVAPLVRGGGGAPPRPRGASWERGEGRAAAARA